MPTGTVVEDLLSEGAIIEIDSLAVLDQMRSTSSKASYGKVNLPVCLFPFVQG